MSDKIIVLDFGSQYNQLIARRIREFHVYSELHPHTMTLEEIRALGDVKGIIFSLQGFISRFKLLNIFHVRADGRLKAQIAVANI